MEKTGLEDFHFFNFLKEEDLLRLKEISVKKYFNKDEILFYKGDEPKYLHLLIKGIAKLYTYDHKDNEVIIHNLMAPSLVAEIVNYEEMNFPANCSFETKAEVLLIDYEKFKKEFLLKPEISMFFIKSLTKKIKALESFINYNISSNSLEKIAKFLSLFIRVNNLFNSRLNTISTSNFIYSINFWKKNSRSNSVDIF
mgnify:CR=1 FL=1